MTDITKRYIVKEEKVVGTTKKNHVVVDTNTHGVCARFADKEIAEGVAEKANEAAGT